MHERAWAETAQPVPIAPKGIRNVTRSCQVSCKKCRSLGKAFNYASEPHPPDEPSILGRLRLLWQYVCLDSEVHSRNPKPETAPHQNPRHGVAVARARVYGG